MDLAAAGLRRPVLLGKLIGQPCRVLGDEYHVTGGLKAGLFGELAESRRFQFLSSLDATLWELPGVFAFASEYQDFARAVAHDHADIGAKRLGSLLCRTQTPFIEVQPSNHGNHQEPGRRGDGESGDERQQREEEVVVDGCPRGEDGESSEGTGEQADEIDQSTPGRMPTSLSQPRFVRLHVGQDSGEWAARSDVPAHLEQVVLEPTRGAVPLCDAHRDRHAEHREENAPRGTRGERRSRFVTVGDETERDAGCSDDGQIELESPLAELFVGDHESLTIFVGGEEELPLPPLELAVAAPPVHAGIVAHGGGAARRGDRAGRRRTRRCVTSHRFGGPACRLN